MSMLAAVVSALLAQAAPARAEAQQPPAEQDAATVEGVVVQGRRISEEEQRRAVSAFVRELSAPTARDRLARWDRELCTGVVGLSAKNGAYVADRIAMETQAVGLEPGGPGCRPDVLILVTRTPDKVAADFRRQHRTFFAHIDGPGEEESGGGGQGLREFLTTPRPVRWWHVARRTGSDGRPIAGGILQTTSASRLASNYKEDISRALIIVDATKMQGVDYEMLASYLAMISLAQLDPQAEPEGLSTIMTLFADRDAGRPSPDTLTEHDRAYLKGLYAAPADARNLNAQRGAIRRRLQKVGR